MSGYPPYFPNNQLGRNQSLQNIVGNPILGDASYQFRPVPPGHTAFPSDLPSQWGGGDFGLEPVQNPVRPINQYGKHQDFPENFVFKEPLLLHGDSDERDVTSYPNAAQFRLKFPKALRGVYSIEVLDVNWPNQTGNVIPPGRIVYLLAGRVDPANGEIKSMEPEMGIYETLQNTNLAPGAPTNTLSSLALAKLPYDSLRPNQLWQRGEYRFIKYFDPVRDKLDFIDVALTDKNGVLYDLDANAPEWSFTLEIVCKQ